MKRATMGASPEDFDAAWREQGRKASQRGLLKCVFVVVAAYAVTSAMEYYRAAHPPANKPPAPAMQSGGAR